MASKFRSSAYISRRGFLASSPSLHHTRISASPRRFVNTSRTTSDIKNLNSKGSSKSNMSTESGKFIVVFKDDVTSDQISEYVNQLKEAGGSVKSRFDQDGGILNGFAATIPESYLTQLQSLVGGVVDYIEPDGVVTTQ
ncbi:hypothetical protein BDN70DRAFT_874834 [Pholiota conissans]|uniref:Inhibitor I9 domain-containing protein n=1 Tax=Pholiota conissans TaxID=109636 RepID=A0A9P6CX72_9AGAR|nr:hypothetical protein BDN70DRAFT_874834 [Pholiota conissans]